MAQNYIQVPDPSEIRFTNFRGEPMWDHEAVEDSNGVILREGDGSPVTRRKPALRSFYRFLLELTLDPKLIEKLTTPEAIELLAEMRGNFQRAEREAAAVIVVDGDHLKRIRAVLKEPTTKTDMNTAHNLLGWVQVLERASEKDPRVALATETSEPPRRRNRKTKEESQ